MKNKILSTKTLEDILQRTRGALEDGRTQIFEVAEAARQECTRTESVLNAVRLEMLQAISDVEDLTKKFNRIKVQLFKSNRDFQEYSEREKQAVYEEATQIREALTAAKERESLHRIRRDNLEQTLARLQEIAAKAERLISQVGAVLDYLSGSMSDVNQQLENMQARELVGQEILKGQEIERRRMAGALHDGPAQDLAHLVVQLEVCERLFQTGQIDEARESYRNLKSIAQGSMGELRRIIYDLNPMTLDDLGLVVTLKNFLDNFAKQTGVETQFILLGQEVRLENQIEMAVFRIIQESLNNIRKHAKARLIEVTLEFSSQFISAEVKDDGLGFDLAGLHEKLKSGKHYGLLSMESRTNVLGGTIGVHSQPGKGTKILVRIPAVNGNKA